MEIPSGGGIVMAVSTKTPAVIESGDRLTRKEFHRRYSTRPDIKKAELVLGVVYVASPTRAKQHGVPHGLIGVWIGVFAARTPGLIVAENATVILDPDSEVQPDVLAFWDPPRGDGARFTSDGYIEGPPLLVIEVAASSVSYDLHDKMEAYRRAGVPEYIAWRVLDEAVDWFRLRDGQYVRLEPNEHGVIESEVLPGLRLPVDRLLAGDAAAVLAAINVKL
jgi:Uma2 family endonuclease